MLILASQGAGKLRGAGWAIASLILALLASGYLGGMGKIADWDQRGQLGGNYYDWHILRSDVLRSEKIFRQRIRHSDLPHLLYL